MLFLNYFLILLRSIYFQMHILLLIQKEKEINKKFYKNQVTGCKLLKCNRYIIHTWLKVE